MSAGFGKNQSTGSGKSQSSSTQGLNPANENAQLGNVANAQAAGAGYTPYTGELVAPTNANEQQGWQGLLGIANNNPGAATLQDAVNTTQGVANYQPSTVTAGQLANTDLSPYENRYTSDVINTTMSQLARQNSIANVANDSAATSAGAFGGDRTAVQDALTNEGYSQTAASTIAGLNQANFNQAQGAAATDIGNKLAADQSNQTAGLTGANLNLNAAAQEGSLSDQQLAQATALQNLIEGVGKDQQTQQQNVDTANQQNNQQTVTNQQSWQQLINAALAALGNPTLTQSQSTGQNQSQSTGVNANGGVTPPK